MSLLDFTARLLKLRQKQAPRLDARDPRILVIRRNRMGDMIYTLPLLHAIRRHFPEAHLTVACDPLGAAIARACEAVNEVIVLKRSWNPWQAVLTNAASLQDYDWVIAAKGGFDRRLAMLTRLTNAALRIGFEPATSSAYYTDPVSLPENPNEEHQIETLLRLLKPLGLLHPTPFTINLSLRIPEESVAFAKEACGEAPFVGNRIVLINFSSTVGLKFREQDFIELGRRILSATEAAIGFVAAPLDQQKAREIAFCIASKRIAAIDTPGPLDLAALLEKASVLITPEGGAAHLAAAVGTPALVLWSEGPFKKWYSRGRRHAFVHAEPGEEYIPLERVWQALQPFLPTRHDDLEQLWSDALELPPTPDFMP
jgi:ADP-heptose:LPS heptosyltransferase